jgi:phosphohistidine swiveling domain-containing protein
MADSQRTENFKIRLLRRVYENELRAKVDVIIQQWQTQLPIHLANFEKNKSQSLNWSPLDVGFAQLLKDIELAGCAYNRLDFAIYFYKNILKYFIETFVNESEPNRLAQLTSQSSFQIGRYIQEQIAKANDFENPNRANEWLVDKLGHLSLSWDISKPTYSEQPQLLERMISDHSQMKNKLATVTPLSDTSEIEKQFIQLVACDEQHRFYASYQFPLVRRLLLSLGSFWKDKNLVAEAGDIFYLTLPELNQYHDNLLKKVSIDKAHIQAIVFIRKSYLKKEPVEGLNSDQMIPREELFYTSTEMQKPAPTNNFEGTGIAASLGTAQGLAFWVTDYDSLNNVPVGAIVLCETPSPTFHSAFLKAAAIVSETAGLLSHGAIVARELRIPCLLQVPDLKSIKNGDLILVDATNGIVKRLT